MQLGADPRRRRPPHDELHRSRHGSASELLCRLDRRSRAPPAGLTGSMARRIADAAAAGCLTAAGAHGLVGKQDVPVPKWLFAWAAALVLVISFLAGILLVSPAAAGGERAARPPGSGVPRPAVRCGRRRRLRGAGLRGLRRVAERSEQRPAHVRLRLVLGRGADRLGAVRRRATRRCAASRARSRPPPQTSRLGDRYMSADQPAWRCAGIPPRDRASIAGIDRGGPLKR